MLQLQSRRGRGTSQVCKKLLFHFCGCWMRDRISCDAFMLRVAGCLVLFGILAIGVRAQAPGDCYARYDQVGAAARAAYWNAPEASRDSLRQVYRAVSLVQESMLDYPQTVSPACGEPLRTAEAQVMVWRQRGWLPTREERAAANRAAALRSLNDALAAAGK